MARRVGTLFAMILCLVAVPLFSQPAEQTTKADYTKESAVVEESVTQATFENDGTGTRTARVRVRVQSDAGVQKFGLLQFSYQASVESLDIDYIRVRKADGSVVVTPADSIQDMAKEITRTAPFYSDLREKHVAVKGLGAGDTLEYQGHWTVNKPLAPGEFWLDYTFDDDQIVLDERLEVRTPKQRAIKFKSPERTPSITEDGNYRVYTWKGQNLKTKVASDDDKVQKVVETMRGRLPGPDVRVSSFQSWEEVGRWYGDLQKERIQATPDIQAKAAELTKGAADDDAKLRAIYNYVALQFRYIGVDFGIGRYQPHSAGEVLSNQYGDCKDKHTLLAALAGAVGIKVYPALIGITHEVDPDVPTPSQFDHVISVAPRSKDLVWLDTTSEVAPFGFLYSPLLGKHALLIPDDQAPGLVATPAARASKGLTIFRIDAKLDDSGTLEGNVERENQGDDQSVLLRQAFRSVPFPQWKDLIQQISYNSGFAGDVSDVSASSPEATDKPLRYSYHYKREDYPDWEHRRVSPPLPPILLPPPRDKDKKSSTPIWLGAPQEIDFESSLKVPKGYRPEPPDAINQVYDFGEYHATYELKDGNLLTKRILLIKMPEVPAKEEGEYKTFQKAVSNDHDEYVPVGPASMTGEKTDGLPGMTTVTKAVRSLPDSTNPDAEAAEEGAFTGSGSKGMSGAASALERAVALDPKFTRAWVKLGTAYMFSGRKEDGIKAFHAAIAIDPKQASVYKVLGYELMSQRNFEEAAKVWQELLANVPGDADGAAQLGGSLLELQRYPEAVTALESAVKLNPERLSLQFQLGTAYLKAGMKEKGLDVFERQLEKDPEPVMLNNIAYTIADAGVAWPEALTYARKAVQAEEEKTRKMTLASLSDDDLKEMETLGMYWDTLGWVHFRMGDLAEAEKFLRAAWMLAQNAVTAEHLGEVYEQEHKKEAARQMYQLSLGALSVTSGMDPRATMEKIKKLGPLPTQRISRAGGADDLSAVRTTKLPRVAQGQATADFFLLFAPGGKVEDIKFVSGSEKLKSAGKTLLLTKFDVPFPEGSDARVVRRGLLSCYPISGCDLVFLTLDQVKSVE